MKKVGIISLAAIIVFLLLISYNYFAAQRAISEERTSITSTDIISYPPNLTQGNKGEVVWRVEVPEGLRTEFTTIYYGYESSPSALTDYDSPQAVGYPNYPRDYESGEFPLPSDFSVSISLDRTGKVYVRSYALVQGRHLWSPEYSFLITAPSNVQ